MQPQSVSKPGTAKMAALGLVSVRLTLLTYPGSLHPSTVTNPIGLEVCTLDETSMRKLFSAR